MGEDKLENLPNNSTLKEQIKLYAKNILILKPASEDTEEVEPFALDFMKAWKGKANSYNAWHVRNRAQDADELGDALLWLITNTSGVLCQISLEPRTLPINKSTEPKKKQNVQIVGPKHWTDFMNQGHGFLRGKDCFEPKRLVNEKSAPLYWIDETPRYGKLKKRHKKLPQ
jgi:hypothetical protein